VYTFPEPPIVLLIAGLLASLAAGKAFEVTLKQRLAEWSRTRSTRIISNLQGPQLLVPFLGIAGGVWIFLASGLSIFGLPDQFSYPVSGALTIATAGLVWSQLGKLLVMLEQGGSRAIDLDALDARE
jgi:hypothetical protein